MAQRQSSLPKTVAHVGVLLAALLSACGTTTATPPAAPCNATTVLEAPNAELALVQAQKDHTPTTLEIKVAALMWGQALLAAEGEAASPLLTEAPVADLLHTVPTAYPSLFPAGSACGQWATKSAALIGSSKDFACTNSCVPDPKLLVTTGKTLLDSVTAKLVTRLKALGKLTTYTQQMRDRTATILKAQRKLQQQYKVAGQVYTHSQQVLDLLDIVDKTLDLQESTELVGDVASVVGDVAGLVGAQQVAAVVLAFQVGYEIGTVANLVVACEVWKSGHCGLDVVSGETNGGGDINADVDATGGQTLKGEFKAGTTGGNGDCTWSFSMVATVTVNGFGGGGSVGNPYRGNVGISGLMTVSLISGDSGCSSATETAPVEGFTGTFGGTDGFVVFAGTTTVSPMTFSVAFPKGVWNGTTVTGPMTIAFPKTEANIPPFSATLVLDPP